MQLLYGVIVWKFQTWVHAVLNHELVLILRPIHTQGLSAQGDHGVSGWPGLSLQCRTPQFRSRWGCWPYPTP